jgi:hypothetical protein
MPFGQLGQIKIVIIPRGATKHIMCGASQTFDLAQVKPIPEFIFEINGDLW